MKLMQCFHECSQKIQNFLQMENSSKESQMATIFAKLLAGAFIFESGETDLKKIIAKATKWAGDDILVILTSNELREALICASVDYAIVGVVQPSTKKLFSSLDSPSKVMAEVLFMNATGQEVLNKTGKWNPGLWKLKIMCKKYIELSPSKVDEVELSEVVKTIAIPFANNICEHAAKLVQN